MSREQAIFVFHDLRVDYITTKALLEDRSSEDKRSTLIMIKIKHRWVSEQRYRYNFLSTEALLAPASKVQTDCSLQYCVFQLNGAP